jgi:hypothetical protein
VTARLLYRDRDFDAGAPLPPQSEAICQDFGLERMFAAMGEGDPFVSSVAKSVLLTGDDDIDTIYYRQDVLKDCIGNVAAIEALYAIARKALAAEAADLLGTSARSVSMALVRSKALLESLRDALQKIRKIAGEYEARVRSEGLRTLFGSIRDELNDAFFAAMRRHLKELNFSGGMHIGARLGEGNKGADYVLHRQPRARGQGVSFRVSGLDGTGRRALEEIKLRSLSRVARALAQSVDHILAFLRTVETELAFYLGCARLHAKLQTLGYAVCFPRAGGPHERKHSVVGLYDIGAALSTKGGAVVNDVEADEKALVIVTGANRGGQSTFLRSVGVAQLMMQCGMFVAARSFHANICERIFTHFRRADGFAVKDGRLEEELGRMSAIVDHLVPNSMLLFNESFAAGDEIAGSEIAEHLVRALIDRHIKIFYATHRFEFAQRLWRRGLPDVLFLRGERRGDGTATFRMAKGYPHESTHGEDLYREVFGEATAPFPSEP